MSNYHPRINGVIGLLAVTPFLFAAENPVAVESLTEAAGPAPIIEEQPSDAGETQYQMQLLQQEVMTLRGLVEELQFQVNRMRTTQEDRYLEMDKRLQDLVKGVPLAPPKPVVEVEAADTVTDSVTDAGGVQTEKSLYDTALELIRNRQYDLAITQMQAVIAQYPDGTYAPNAYYWIGEVYSAKPEPDYEQARQALAQVITFFPDHQKVPDAAFKLGKVYHLMGDCERAKDLLNQVVEQQQGRSVGKLAESYLRDKVDC